MLKMKCAQHHKYAFISVSNSFQANSADGPLGEVPSPHLPTSSAPFVWLSDGLGGRTEAFPRKVSLSNGG